MDAIGVPELRRPAKMAPCHRSAAHCLSAVGLVLFLAACSAAVEPHTPALTAEGLCLDGLFVRPHAGNLQDLLERRYRQRSPEWFNLSTPGPLVLIDGVQVDGLQRLAALEPANVANVEMLDASRAVPEFGARAREGAVVVVTKGGRTAGVDMRPGARPVMPCRGRTA